MSSDRTEANVSSKTDLQRAVRSKDVLGISVRKDEDLSEWYTQVVLKSELADYTSAKGFVVIRPYGNEIWELIKNYFDSEIRKTGHRNAYFPTLIPESLMKKEAEHFSGFTPEVFWVTHTGTYELPEKFAVRPTSETIIHESMRRWIRSWRDLPMLLNLWNSVLRAEIKSTKPFIRTTEFLWQEGHTAHASEKEAEREVLDILYLYKKVMEELVAVPVLIGKKSEKEKFVGAAYTTTLEAMMPDGRAIQMGTSHHLGQNFSKPFEIRFLGEDGEMHFVWQTSWGISWRLIGALILEHGDDKGLVLPPRVAPIQVVIVPILFSSKNTEIIIEKCNEVRSVLLSSGIRVHIDSRDHYTPGWKFNEWELKGVPIRMEIGPRDISSGSAILVRRDSGKKESIKFEDVANLVQAALEDIQRVMLERSAAKLKEQTSEASTFEELTEIIDHKGGFVGAFWCESPECETRIKEKTGADIRVIPLDKTQNKRSNCIICGKETDSFVYFARAY